MTTGASLLSKLTLTNFRGFERHVVPFRPSTVIVGRNNAGKSTVIEALRLVSLVSNRLGKVNFRDAPTWTNLSRRSRGIRPSLEDAGFDFTNAFHRYKSPPAEIIAEFTNGCKINILIGPDSDIHSRIYKENGSLITSKSTAATIAIAPVAILPPIGPLVSEETVLSADRIRKMLNTPFASQHFRNQLHYNPSSKERFIEYVSETWPGIRIHGLETSDRESSDPVRATFPKLTLLIQDKDYVGEVCHMGHGLQMWLQVMWFLARTPDSATIILDEPDVYMHPDLQRRLFRLIHRTYSQSVIATHSAEIISDAHPDAILIIDREHATSDFASGLPAVQRVIDNLGGVHNLHMARLWSTKRFLLVEGDDLSILDPLHSTLFPKSSISLQAIPNRDVGGWDGWARALGIAAALRNAVGEPILVYALFDKDYHSAAETNERYQQAENEKICLHIWGRKEIENYLLVPETLERLISSKKTTTATISIDDVVHAIDRAAESLKEDTIGAIVTAKHNENRRLAAGTAYMHARTHVEEAWRDRDNRWAIVSGKRILAMLSAWSKSQYGVSFGAITVARAMLAEEIPEEMRAVLGAIEACQQFAGLGP